ELLRVDIDHDRHAGKRPVDRTALCCRTVDHDGAVLIKVSRPIDDTRGRPAIDRRRWRRNDRIGGGSAQGRPGGRLRRRIGDHNHSWRLFLARWDWFRLHGRRLDAFDRRSYLFWWIGFPEIGRARLRLGLHLDCRRLRLFLLWLRYRLGDWD